MKAIVHIGTEKTGSTSIQEYLYRNREILSDFGYYFVQSAGTRNNRDLVACCMSDDKYDDFFEARGIRSPSQKDEFRRDFLSRFDEEIKSIPKPIHTVIISSEHFHSRTNRQEEVDNVHDLLSLYFSDFKIVCYLRDQVATCTSYYSTAIKVGHCPTFKKFLQGCRSDNIYYNYSAMLSNWENAFGLKSLHVSLFSEDQFVNRNLLDDFTAKLDPALVGQLDKDISTENESLSYAGQVLGKAVNRVFSQLMLGPEVSGLRHRVQKVIYENCKGKGEQPSLEARRRIYANFADSNERVRKKFFPEKLELFPPVLEETETDKAIDVGFIDALSGVLEVIVEGQINNILPTTSKSRLPDSFADTFRNAALKIEKQDMKLAYELMALAHEVRPAGPYIKQKLDEYRQKLGEEKKPFE